MPFRETIYQEPVRTTMASPKTPRHRAVWSMVDQTVSSFSSFALLFLVIYTSTTVEVGAFSLAYTTFFSVQAIVRGLALDPLIVRFAASDQGSQRNATRSATGLVLGLAVAIATPTVLVGLLMGGPVGQSFAAIGVMLPGLLVQHAWRMAFFCFGQPQGALWNDLCYLGVQVLAFLYLAYTGNVKVVTLISAWGVAATVAAAFGMLQSGLVPDPLRALAWFRAQRDLGLAFAADYGVNRGGEQVAMIAIGVVGGLGNLGAVATARSLFSPLTTVQSGFSAFAMPEMSRMYLAHRVRELRTSSWLFGIASAAMMLLAGGILGVLPRDLGMQLFGRNWNPARNVLLPMTVFSALNAIGYAVWVCLRAMQIARPTLYVRSAAGVLTIAFAAGGALILGALGAAWGLVVGAAFLWGGLSSLLFRHWSAAAQLD